MAIPITVPRLGWSMEEGTFLEWLKKDGDRIQPGDLLFILESEKAAENIEALDPGTLGIPADSPQPGDKVKVGQILAYLLAAGEAIPTADKPKSEVVREASPVVQPSAGPAARKLARTLGVDLAQVSASGGRISELDVRVHSQELQRRKDLQQPKQLRAISPRARRVAVELGVNWAELAGTGGNGRIRERDVRAAGDDASEGRVIPHTSIRRLIAARMVAGVTQAAPVTLITKADATHLVHLRQQFKAAAESTKEAMSGYTDFIVRLTAGALREHPLLQGQWRDDGLFVPKRIHIAMAVDTEYGLLVPVLRDVDQLTLRQVAAQSRDLTDLARAGKLTADQMRGATFTITNLGMFGIDAFTPIIYLPQSAVLGVGRIVREPAVVSDQIVPRDMLTLSLSFDHRVVDGAPAARFLNALRQRIEQPAPWLLP